MQENILDAFPQPSGARCRPDFANKSGRHVGEVLLPSIRVATPLVQTVNLEGGSDPPFQT